MAARSPRRSFALPARGRARAARRRAAPSAWPRVRRCARDPAQDGVDERRIGLLADRPRPAHGEVDRRVVGDLEEQELRRAHQERAFQARRIGGKAAVEAARDQAAQGAEPPERGRDDATDERAVALGEEREPWISGRPVELLVERSPAMQHAFDNVGRGAARREPRSLCRRRQNGASYWNSGADWSLFSRSNRR